jgi:outer membrane protein, heavy metal efflux system
MRKGSFQRRQALILAVALSGCAGYHAEPLGTHSNLASSVAALNRTVPSTNANQPAVILPATQAFSIDEIGLLAILNDPDLASEYGQVEQARAALITATTLPNPQLGLGFFALLGGPGSTPAYAVSLSQDITSLITYRPRAAAARAAFGSVNAQLLWQEWLVAQQARLLAVDIYGSDQEINIRTQELSVLTSELAQVHQAATAGNFDLSDEAPLSAAVAGAESELATAQLTRQQSWQSLDALLGLQPSVRFDILPPAVAAPPADMASLMASVPERRPDLLALQLGYAAADDQVRAAILAQFPGLSLGPAFGSDTSNVRSLGPQATIDLPIFDRNQGGVAGARATRDVLHAQYQAELDSTAGTVQSLGTNIATLESDLSRARIAATEAQRVLDQANRAYSKNSVDQRALADYQTTALERDLDVINFQSQLDADRLALEIELGLGLPQMRIAPQPNADPAPTHKVSHT